MSDTPQMLGSAHLGNCALLFVEGGDTLAEGVTSLINAVYLALCGLHVQSPHVLPVLFQKGNKEVHGNTDVLDKLVRGLGNVSDGNANAKHLLQLELHSATKLVDLGEQVIRVGEEGRELVHLVQTRNKTGDLSDDDLRGKESIILLSQLLDQLLVFVELLQHINVHEVNSGLLGLLNVLSISEHANIEPDFGDVGKFDLSTETLILLGVVIFQPNLELHSLCEHLGLLGVLLLGLLDRRYFVLINLLCRRGDGSDCCTQHIAWDFAHC